MKKKKLGEILLDAGVITPRQLGEALEDQKRYGGRLGTILLDRRFITEKEFFSALTRQLGIPAIDFTKSTIPEAVIHLIPQEVAEKHNVFPVALKRTPQGNVLVLAMGDPTNVEIQDEVRFTTSYKVEPALALDNTIRYVLRDYYYHADGKGPYRMQPDPDLGPANHHADVAAEDNGDLIEHYSKIGEDASPEMMTGPPENGATPENTSDKPSLTRELRTLLKLLARKGILTPKEYLDTFKETK